MGGGGKGGGGGGDSTTTIRYAPYLETAHKALIDQGNTEVSALINNSPFAAFTVVNPDAAFFGLGYTISSFPALFDMFGKFMAGLDIEVLHTQLITDSIYGSPLSDAVAAQSAYLDDEVVDSYTRLSAGARDINAVMSTGLMAAKADIEDGKLKAINKYAADLKVKFTELGHQRWEKHLAWNDNVVKVYSNLNQLYFSTSNNYVSAAGKLAESNAVWPFQVLDYQRTIVACMSGATNSKSKQEDQGGIGGVLSVVSSIIGIAGLLL